MKSAMKSELLFKFNIEKIRKDFPILERKMHGKKIAYFDSAASSLTPEPVLKAMQEYYHEYRSNVHRGIYQLSELATQQYEAAHTILASFINAQPEEIIFTRNTTESLNLLAYSLTRNLQQGDEIILTEIEHHSNLVPWQQLAKEKNLILKFIKVSPEGRLDLQHARNTINRKTKIVSLTYISNLLGSINPVKEIINLAHAQNAICIIDAAQAVPHMPVDVKSLDVDFLAFSGHKMLGPTGIGCLYGKKHLLESLPPFNYGGGMIAEVTYQDTKFREPPIRFEAGTPAIAEAIGLAAAIQYLQEIGMQNIHEYTSLLTQEAYSKLKEIPGIELYGPGNSKERTAIISFNIPGIHPHDVAAILDREGVCIRAGHMCVMPFVKDILKQPAICRASFYLYNTPEDIQQFIAAIKKAKEVFKK